QERARQQQTWLDRAARGWIENEPTGAAIKTAVGLVSPQAARNLEQFQEEAGRKATLGWMDPTLPGKAEGEQYDTPGAMVGRMVGGAAPMMGAYAVGNIVGGPVGGSIAAGVLPLIERRPDESEYDFEQRLGEGLVQGATAGVLGPVSE